MCVLYVDTNLQWYVIWTQLLKISKRPKVEFSNFNKCICVLLVCSYHCEKDTLAITPF